MPIQKIAGTDYTYYLIVHDDLGNERAEPDGTFLSKSVLASVADRAHPVTDVFLACHGWQGDVPAAISQYDAWVGAMAGRQQDIEAARRLRAGFNPLIVGLHWPSLPWGDESIPPAGGGLLSADDPVIAPIETDIEFYAKRIADTPTARASIRTVLQAARVDRGATVLPPAARDALKDLFAESGLGHGDPAGRPGTDQDGFDPDKIISDAIGAPANATAPGVLGIGDTLRNALLLPLRQLSFWKMKDRARQFGETDATGLLRSLQSAAPRTRFHLMGHSFGCIVVSAAVAGPAEGTPPPRPVDSLFLVQGALSLWSYAADIPYAHGVAGYFNRIVNRGLVAGPIVTTRSTHDTAVGRFYPLGAQLAGQFVLDVEYPKYGGLGAFGIRGFTKAKDLRMLPAAAEYGFDRGAVYNLEASDIIKNGSGPAGAHSDIAHPEVAHAFWSAALAGHPLQSDSGSPGLLTASDDGSHAPSPGSGGGILAQVLRSLPDNSFANRVESKIGEPDNSDRPDLQSILSNLLGTAAPGAPPPAPEAPAQAPADQRWINAEIEGQPPDQPLSKGSTYSLAFDIDVVRHKLAVGLLALAESQLWSGGEDEIELTVQLVSTDFGISTPTQPLRLRRAGRSLNKAQFNITPLHDGRSALTATIHKLGNFIQQMDLVFTVGAAEATAVEVTARGRLPSAAAVVQPRYGGLSIWPENGLYGCAVWGTLRRKATLDLQPVALESAIEALRQELRKVIEYHDSSGQLIFQAAVDIADPKDRDFALKTMAHAGAELLRRLFFGPGASLDSKAVGNYLKNLLLNDKPLKFQILSEQTPVPWALLYLGDVSDGATLSWNNFIGMRHVIEQIPSGSGSVVEPTIPSDKPKLAVSVNVNADIDNMPGKLVSKQQQYWRNEEAARRSLGVVIRSDRKDIVQALCSDKTADQILYFFCHAASKGLGDPGGPTAAALGLTGANVTLDDLYRNDPATAQFGGSPLVFINACESADLSATFYDGFVPYFMAKGARGVVGTECVIPALFACTWSERFFKRFLDGQPLGDAFRDLRVEFVEASGNPLGLLYAVYCDGDTQIDPALVSQATAEVTA